MAREGDGNSFEDVAGISNRSPCSLIILSLLLTRSLSPLHLSTARSFITIKDQKFVDENCNDYVVAG